jgi:hypothetical protein
MTQAQLKVLPTTEACYTDYADRRRAEYPSIEEQLDALYHAGAFPPDMAERIHAVKLRYPKPDAPAPVLPTDREKNTCDDRLATTKWVQSQRCNIMLTGMAVAPAPKPHTRSNQIATTKFVMDAIEFYLHSSIKEIISGLHNK